MLKEPCRSDVIDALSSARRLEMSAGASNFNALGRPGTVLIGGNVARLVKRADTLEDVLARDQPLAAGVIL